MTGIPGMIGVPADGDAPLDTRPAHPLPLDRKTRARAAVAGSVGNLIEAALVTSFKMSSPFGESDRHVATANKHRLIVEAIERRDGDAASAAMEQVIKDGFTRISKKLL